MSFVIDDRADPDDVAELHELINSFNALSTGVHDGRDMTIIQRDADGRTTAGMHGWTWGGCAEIDVLWVAAPLRHTGLGTALLRAAETEALARGCTQVVLSTHSFQAPDFYQRLGYRIYGEVDGYPAGHRHIHLVKSLVAPPR